MTEVSTAAATQRSLARRPARGLSLVRPPTSVARSKAHRTWHVLPLHAPERRSSPEHRAASDAPSHWRWPRTAGRSPFTTVRARAKQPAWLRKSQRRAARAAAFHCDLADGRAVADLVPRVSRELGAPTCLVNNASEFLLDTLGSVTPETWDTHLDINLKAPVFLAQALSAICLKAQVATSSTSSTSGCGTRRRSSSPTRSPKSGLWTATQTLAQAMAPRVRVNAIGPGPVLQSVHQAEPTSPPKPRDAAAARGRPSEIAAAVRFILATPSMTGQMIALDGGQHLT